MTKAQSVKGSTVTVAIPAVNKAWRSFASVTHKSDEANRLALRVLSAVVKNQTAPATAVAKSIEATGAKSSLIGYGTVKALPTWLALDIKHTANPEWKAMTLKAQLTLATKSYSLLGKEQGEKIATFADFKNECANAQAEKTRKAKAAKSSGKADATPKKNADLESALKAFYIMVTATTEEEWSDARIEQFNEISAVVEQKYMADIDA